MVVFACPLPNGKAEMDSDPSAILAHAKINAAPRG